VRVILGIIAGAVLAGLGAGCAPSEPSPGPPVAVTSPLLRCAVLEMLGPDAAVLSLTGPGMCPGHFDVGPPGQVRALRGVRILLRFDFQADLDKLLEPHADGELHIVPVKVPGGMAEPRSFAAVCEQVAEALVAAGLLGREAADARLADVQARMEALETWARQTVRDAGLAGQPVVASRHQAAFCRALGLDVKATFSAADTAGMGEVRSALAAGRAAGATLVIANRPEGRQAADALAESLGARVVVFDNFPDEGPRNAFEAMVRGNVERLTAEGRP